MNEKTISVVITQDPSGHVTKAYASKDAAVIIEVSNTLHAAGYEATVFNCDLITKAPRIRRPRKSRSKE